MTGFVVIVDLGKKRKPSLSLPKDHLGAESLRTFDGKLNWHVLSKTLRGDGL